MTKYDLFQLIWQGYQQNHIIAAGYAWDDLSNMSYADMASYFNLLSTGFKLEHRYNDAVNIVFPVII